MGSAKYIDRVGSIERNIRELGILAVASIPPWEPTPARLIPTLDPWKVAADLINAIREGVHNALALIGSPARLRVSSPLTVDRNAAVERAVSAPETRLTRVGRKVAKRLTGSRPRAAPAKRLSTWTMTREAITIGCHAGDGFLGRLRGSDITRFRCAGRRFVSISHPDYVDHVLHEPALQIRRDGLDPAPELGEVRASTGLRTMLNVFGVPVHLVTRYSDVKAVLADHERFSNGQPAGFVMPGAPPLSADEAADPQAGNLLALDPPEHQRLRRMLTGEFTTRRMTRLQPRIAEIVEQQLDELERHGAPADLVSMFALPIPSLVICELLGVPYSDREDFQRRSDSLIDVSMPFAQRYRLQRDSHDYMRSLVKQARSHPDDDMLGMLVREHGDTLTDQELTAVCGLLLLAGHETTSSMLGLGTLALLRHPDQLAAMRDDPDRVSPAIEELLRYLSILHHSIPRITTADVEICGVTIPAGELVLASLAAANRDPAFFGDPDILDIHRDAASHIAFGHGVHHCIGAPLARMELRIALPALLRRFPHLALAEDFETVKYHSFHLIYGLQSLAVRW